MMNSNNSNKFEMIKEKIACLEISNELKIGLYHVSEILFSYSCKFKNNFINSKVSFIMYLMS